MSTDDKSTDDLIKAALTDAEIGPEAGSRRPLSSRETGWAKALAQRLSNRQISPNQISLASVGFGALGGFLFAAAPDVSGLFRGLVLLLAAGLCQARLLCNLMDGMVAIEGEKSTKDGVFWNEAPDRASDILLFWGAGVAAGSASMGLLVAALAVTAAYLREMGRAEGLAPDFGGPMAKPHRMAALTVGAVIAAFAPFGYSSATIMLWTLMIILLGTALTIGRRSRRLIKALDAR